MPEVREVGVTMPNPILQQNVYWVVRSPDGTEAFLLASPNKAPDVPPGFTVRLATLGEVEAAGGNPPEESSAGWLLDIPKAIGDTVGQALGGAISPVLTSLMPLFLLAGAVFILPSIVGAVTARRQR